MGLRIGFGVYRIAGYPSTYIWAGALVWASGSEEWGGGEEWALGSGDADERMNESEACRVWGYEDSWSFPASSNIWSNGMG